jgi:hypothetical protein
MTARVTLLPSARRLINSLRDIGYDLPNAVSDIVDNSIAANASRIDLTFRFDGLRSSIVIADNGFGMAPAVLDEAMRYGTKRGYGTDDLGRYGLGLKTASLSQCRSLTVASRQARDRRRIAVRRWDLDEVLRSDRWEVLNISAARAAVELTKPIDHSPGTVVMWEGLDRILDYSIPDGGFARRGFDALADEVRDHIAMVFHRFLAGEARGRRRLQVTINGTAIAPWDPFARDEPHTRALEPQRVTLNLDGRRRDMLIRPHILPQQNRFSTAAAHARAAGPSRWNRQQGLYFYRHDRLVQGGGWNRLRTTDEHTKLARIAVDLPEDSEELLGLNVPKMRVNIPRELRNQLTALVSGVAAQAAMVYRGRSESDTRRASKTRGASATAVETGPRLLDHLDASGLDLLRVVAGVVRDELSEEPDALRRVLGRLDRITAQGAIEIVGREVAWRKSSHRPMSPSPTRSAK